MSDATEQLRQEGRRLNQLLGASPGPIWQRDAERRIVYCNDAFSALIDPESDALLDFASIELFRGQSAMAERAQKLGDTVSEEHYVIANGKRKLYRFTETPASDGSLNGFATDISDTDAAREEIARHITAQSDFLESSTSAMTVFSSDQRLQHYNAAFSRFWHLEEAWLDSKPTYSDILERLRERRMLPEQANFPAFKQHHLRWFTDLLEPHEEFLYLPNDKTLRMVIIPHALGGLLFTYEDVTDRLALERSYNTLIAVQQETLDNIYESVVVIGEDGRIKLVNPAFLRLWEVDEAEMNSQPHIRDAIEHFKDHLYFRDWDEYKAAFLARMHERTNETGKLELRNGKFLVWRKIALPDGGTLLAHDDMTASEQLERSLRERNQALEAADKLKTEFLANVSYELRSPLTSITGFSDILAQEYFGELTAKQREYVEGIHQSSQQLSSLINNILDLASIEAGYLQLHITEVNVYTMLTSVMALVAERAKALGITLKQDCPLEIGSIQADETRIRQVIFNLLSNAVKYTEQGGHVTLSARRDGDVFECCVIDDGVGIDPEQQDHIFERFTRSGASKSQQSGSGLGLSIVKSFIELHGGSVAVQSEPGKGACFICRIPFNSAA